MTAQTGATARNTQAELLVDVALRSAFASLEAEGTIASPVFRRQVRFAEDDCSDVFDHRVDFRLAKPGADLKEDVQLWAQTTCYKGHITDTRESNKTYEIRETLVEALGLRRWLRSEGASFRVAHFTVGPAAYAYSWFKDAKDASFDLSFYPSADASDDLFEALDALLTGSMTEDDSRQRIAAESASGRSSIARFVSEASGVVSEWARRGFPAQELADAQSDLLQLLRANTLDTVPDAIARAGRGGAGIKPRVVAVLGGGDDADPAILRTASKVAGRRPFLAAALAAEGDWAEWCRGNVPVAGSSLEEYVQALWCADEPSRGILRRILLRAHSPAGVAYVADLGIAGVTEHTLYGAAHSGLTLKQIVARITQSLRAAGTTSTSLRTLIISSTGKRLLKASRQAESINGTNIKPSFFYLGEALPDQYALKKFSDTRLARPLGYHARLSTGRVDSYTNLEVLVDRASRCPLAIIKAKFFNQPEFPRRVKEESYVGLTVMHELTKTGFKRRYDVPLVMFVDMAASTTPPNYAITRLVTVGWHPVFSLEELLAVVEQ